MSINKPRGTESTESFAGNTFRRALQIVLATSFLAMQPSDSATNEVETPQEEKNYDYLFEGIEIVPDGTIQDEPVLKKTPIIEDPLCTLDSCKPV